MSARRRAGAGCLVLTVLGASAATTALVSTPGVTVQGRPNPLHGVAFHLHGEGHAVQQVLALRESGDIAGAERLRPIAEQPTAVWFTGDDANPGTTAADLTRSAAEAGHVAVLTVYNVPERDCGQHSRGGAASAEQYRTWLTSLARGIGGRQAVVVLEPDAVPHALTGCSGPRLAAQRYRLLDEAVSILDVHAPRASVYIDAGHAAWVEDLPALADALRRSGIGRAAGFALNVSNFRTTRESAEYGQRLSDLLAGAHFVIDTSRNGNGPSTATATGEDAWCNPPGRRIGTPPTSSPALDRVDALLWVKPPGDSDGTCRGGPPAGTWWPAAAVDLLS